MDGFRTAVVGCVCLLLAACGGTTKQASIRRPVAQALASQSDAVAATLRGGDACLALRRARLLRAGVAAAIAEGSIPASLAPDARGAAASIVSRISCTPPPPPPPPALSCGVLEGQQRALEDEKRALGGKHGKGHDARKKQIEQEEHALDRERKGCE